MSLAATHLRTNPESVLLLSGERSLVRGQVAGLVDRLCEQIRARRLPSIVTYTDDAGELVAALSAGEETQVPVVLAHRTLADEEVRTLCRALGVAAYLASGLDWRATGGVAQTPGRDGFTVNLMTSGTTGRPKLVRHRLESLLGRIAQGSGAGLGRGQRWLLAYQPTAFAGVQVILTALCTGGAVVQTVGRTPLDLLAAAERHDVTHISGTPTFWRSFLLAAPPGSLPHLRQITLGGEAVDQQVLDRLSRRFPGARITHIYASSEAGALFSVHDARAGFPAAWLDNGAGGARLRVRDGELEVQSPRRMLGYVGDAPSRLTADGWLVTGDLVAVDGDRVYFRGRTDDILNVGGAKVYPSEVEAFLLSCPGVTEARVRGVSNPISGTVLAAEVVLEPGDDTEARRLELMRLCQASLPAHKAPRLIRVVDRIATLVSGKKA